MRKVFNRKVISNKKKIIDESIVRSKKHYNGLIHAGILRENRLHKKQIKEEAEKKLPLFIRDLKFGKSPASVKILNIHWIYFSILMIDGLITKPSISSSLIEFETAFRIMLYAPLTSALINLPADDL